MALNNQFPKITFAKIKEFKPKAKKEITENRIQIIDSIAKSCKDYFDTESISERWESNCFLLDGKWGSGKSWTLEVVERWIAQNKLKGKKINFLKYSAWQYLNEKDLFSNFWRSVYSEEQMDIEKLLTEIALCPDKAITKANKLFGLMIKTKDYIVDTASYLEENASRIVDFYEKATGVCSDIPIISDAIPILRSIKQSKKFVNLEDGINRLVKIIEEKQENNSDISQQVNVANDFLVSKPTIVVVDDLDRVHEEKLWKILTMLSLFDKIPNLVFICVGSSEYLIEILEKKYHVKGEGENFLTKFFAKEFKLPQASYLDLLIDEFVIEEDRPEVKEFLNIFVEINTYREYKTMYLQPLEELKNSDEFLDKNIFVKELCLIYFDLRFKLIWGEVKKIRSNPNGFVRLDKLEFELLKINYTDDLSKFVIAIFIHFLKIGNPSNYPVLHNISKEYLPRVRNPNIEIQY